MKNNIQKIKASSVLEFLVVFIILFIFFITIIDIGLFFREVYLVQTLADETLSVLQTEHACSYDLDKTARIMTGKIYTYYEKNVSLRAEDENGFLKFSDSEQKYIFNLSCRNPITPDALLFGYKYDGIFLYKRGKMIFSNYSANTSYF